MAFPNVPYHRQEDPRYCGAACLQMTLETVAGAKSDTQKSLYTAAHEHGAYDKNYNWEVAPDGLQWRLQKGLEHPDTAAIAALKDESSLTRRLVWSLYRHSFPPIALVYGWDHWVLVVRYDISAEPRTPADDAYKIAAVEIHDPWRTAEEGDPPPPPPPRHVTLKEWHRTYLKPVKKGYWKDKSVAVGAFGA